jgi:hypothetical protein
MGCILSFDSLLSFTILSIHYLCYYFLFSLMIGLNIL